MTEENYRYRTSQLLLRNQFEGSGAWKIPMIPKAAFDEEEFRDLRLIGFDKTKLEDERHLGRIVHFSSTTTSLRGCGRISIMISKSSNGTGQRSHLISVCI